MGEAALGRIVTFYSYQGGIGRSMAVANTAWMLANAGSRVLVIDWDLESPGLHRYFAGYLVDAELEDSEGLIDFVEDFACAAATPEAGGVPAAEDWYAQYSNLLRNATSIEWSEFPAGATLDLVAAGRQDVGYARKVNLFNWHHFYEKLSGAAFLEAVKRRLRTEYDYILIDSRTGVSDTSGSCTVQMPDDLVVCFAMNRQSIDGAVATAKGALMQRRSDGEAPRLRVWPVAMRVEAADQARLDSLMSRVSERFGSLQWHLSAAERQQYWNTLAILSSPDLTYEEGIAANGRRAPEVKPFLAGIEFLAACLRNGSVAPALKMAVPRRTSGQRLHAAPRTAKPAAFLSYAHWDNEDDYLTSFREALSAAMRTAAGKDFPIFQDREDIEWGSNWRDRIHEALDEVTFLITVLSPNFFSSKQCKDELRTFLDREKKIGRQGVVLPLYFFKYAPLEPRAKESRNPLVRAMQGRQMVDWREFRLKGLNSLTMRSEIETLAGKILARLPKKGMANAQTAGRRFRK